jgi:hypothetical protein
MGNYREQIDAIRSEINANIIALLKKYGYNYEVTICLNDTPILQENPFDDNLTLTLDCVGVRNGEVYFEGSSCCENITLFATQIDVENLIGIYEWLIESEEDIFNEDID